MTAGPGAGDRRGVLALLAVKPEPRRGAVQVAERRGGTRAQGADVPARAVHENTNQTSPAGTIEAKTIIM
jgi:hypothetical protein